MIIGWGGLFAVVNWSSPSGGTRWLFFFTAFLGLCGIALPVVAFLNQRFLSTPPASSSVIVRQSIWIAIFFPTLAWLRIGRVLTIPLALLLAFGLILIEYLLRLRERNQWDPTKGESE